MAGCDGMRAEDDLIGRWMDGALDSCRIGGIEGL